MISASRAFFQAFLVFMTLMVVSAVLTAIGTMMKKKNNNTNSDSRLASAVANDSMAPTMNNMKPYSTPTVGVWE